MKLLKFSATWCGPCKQLATVLSKMTLPCELEDIDVDENSDLAAMYGVRGVPTLMLTEDDGTVIDRLVGSNSEQAVANWIAANTK